MFAPNCAVDVVWIAPAALIMRKYMEAPLVDGNQELVPQVQACSLEPLATCKHELPSNIHIDSSYPTSGTFTMRTQSNSLS